MTKWPARPSFRTRLTVWWTLAFGLLLTIASLAIYATFRTYLERDLDLKVRTVAATELASAIDGLDIHLHEVPGGALAEGQYTEKFVQIFESDGRVRLSSASLGGRPALVPVTLIGEALRGHAPLASVTVGRRHARVTVLGAPMGSRHYAILVGMYRDEIDAHLARLAWLLGAVWACGLGATSALGYGLASRALAPVVGITRRAERIARGDFAARLDPPSSQDEVGEMTQSLNAVLDRLHGALEAHRRFASDASHELRAPMTAMAGEIDVSLMRPRTAAEYRETLVVVGERLSSLTDLCEDLMLLVHAQEGAQGVDLKEVPVLAQLQRSATRLAGAAAARNVSIVACDLPELVAYADPRLLARVLDNVLANAVLYNRDGGRVVISGTAEPASPDAWTVDTAVITVTDTGPGIPVDEFERVFARFYRLDRSRAPGTGGSGLGLAICREVLGVLRGSIRIAASSMQGTTFEIRLPGRLASDRRVSEPLGDGAATPRAADTRSPQAPSS